MNIIKIQDQLKGVPDDALIGYVQNPTGQVPTYLALSELQRRKTMRDTYQQAEPAQTTVAEDLAAPPPMQQGAPTMPADQGVAGLPVPDDMYQDQNFAGGGIVAFDNGGDVSNYRQDQTALNLNLAGNPSENSKDGNPVNAVTNLLGMARMGGVSPNMGMPGGVNGMGYGNPMGLLGLLGLGKQALQPKSYALNLNSGKQEAQYAEGGDVKHYAKGDYVLSSDYDPEAYGTSYREGLAGLDTTYPTYSSTDPYGNVRKKAIKEYQSSVKTPYDDAIKYYEEQGLGYKGKLGVVPYTSPVRKLENAKNEWLASQGTMPAAPAAKPSGQPDVTLTGDAAQNAAKQPFQGVGFDGSFYDKMLKKEKTLQELSDEYKAVLGADPTLAGRQEKLAKMEARAAKMEGQAPWMALAQAGFGMAAGKSPFALQNIAEGAISGVKSYTAAQDKLADLEEKRFALDTELAKQQRAEQMAAITFGDRSRQHTEEMNKTVMLTKAKDKLTRDMGNLEASTNLITKTAANAPKAKDVAEARAAYQGSKAQNEVKKALLKQLGDNADKDTSPRHNEYKDALDLAEENYLARYFSSIGSNIPRASTQGFEITKPKK